MVKFLHIADLHLDRAFEGLATLDKQTEAQLLTANQRVLTRIVDLALAEVVDFLVIAGDTFHQPRPTLKTQKFFIEEMERLNKAEIPVFMIFGNHDYYQADKYWFYFPENIHLYTTENVETAYLTTKAGETVALSGFSFEGPVIKTEKIFPNRGTVDFHIGLYHGGQGDYAPFAISDLTAKHYDYWALGHIHTPQILKEQPWIIYPGAPQGHTQKEETAANVVLVSGTKGHLKVEPRSVAAVFWRNEQLSLKKLRSIKELVPYVKEKIQDLPEFTLLQIRFTDYQQLGREFDFQLHSGELLELLQTVTPTNAYLWQLATSVEAPQEKIYLTADQDLLDNLLKVYEAPEIFSESLKELFDQPELHALLAEAFQKEILAATKTQVLADFSFGGVTRENQTS